MEYDKGYFFDNSTEDNNKYDISSGKCPECGNKLKLITNTNLKNEFEFIPICENCKIAYRK